MAAYVGGTSEQPAYDTYSALWFEEAEALTGFRAWQQDLAGHADKHGAPFRPSLSFFLLTREVVTTAAGWGTAPPGRQLSCCPAGPRLTRGVSLDRPELVGLVQRCPLVERCPVGGRAA